MGVGQAPTAFVLLRRAIVFELYINLKEIYLLASFETGESNHQTLITFGNTYLVHTLEFRIEITGQAVGWCMPEQCATHEGYLSRLVHFRRLINISSSLETI
jgi:hypothetical protein